MQMNPKENPFVPNAGYLPPELAGRDSIIELADILLDRTKNGLPGKSFIMYGLRGVGKTVLLLQIEQMAEDRGYETIHIENDDDSSICKDLAQELRRILIRMTTMDVVGAKLRKGLGILLNYLSTLNLSIGALNIEIKPEIGSADSGNPIADIPSLLVAAGEAAKENNKYIAILLDEIHTVPDIELKALIIAMHRIQQKNLPVILVGAGLPTILAKVGKAKTYTERLFDYPKIGALTKTETIDALQIPVEKSGVKYTRSALDQIYANTRGYPYFIQVWGKITWNLANDILITDSVVAKSQNKVIDELDNGFYRVRYDQLTNKEKNYLRAMAELGEGSQKSSDIAQKLKQSTSSVSVVRDNLISKGVIYSPEYAKLAFTVPLFEKFIMRNIKLNS